MLRTQTRSGRRVAGLLGERRVADLRERGGGRIGGRVYPAQDEDVRRRFEAAWVGPVERGDAALHHALLPEVGQVAGNQRDQERRAGDRAVDPRDLRGLNAQLFGDHRLGDVRALLLHAARPFDRLLAEAVRPVQREASGDVFGVAVGNARQPPPLGQRVSDPA